MDAVIENMRNTFGSGVRKMFSNNNQKSNTIQMDSSDTQTVKMSLCKICEREDSTVPFLVKDICSFISKHAMKAEGIFRVSGSLRQVSELRQLYESNTNFQDELLSNQDDTTEVTGHAAAGLLKQFLRQLPEPLICEDVLRIYVDSKSLSDSDFCDKICANMENWSVPHRCTLLSLLTFLHMVAQESENRMSVNGLAVVFGPNVFRLPDGVEALQAQTIANQAFERLLSCSKLLSERQTKKQPPPRPAPPSRRPLPRLPNEASKSLDIEERPSKPVPVTRRSLQSQQALYETVDLDNIVTMETITEPVNNGLLIGDSPYAKPREDTNPTAAPRSKDLPGFHGDAINKFGVTASPLPGLKREKSSSSSEPEIPEVLERTDSIDETDSGNTTGEFTKSIEGDMTVLDNSIRAIVKTRLFNSESSSMSDEAERVNGLLKSTTAGRNRGPKNRRLPSRTKLLSNVQLDNSDDDDAVNTETKINGDATIQTQPTMEESVNSTSAPVAASSITTVTTPDSGCIVEDRDYPHTSSPIKEELSRLVIGRDFSPVHIPKLNLRNSYDEDDFAKTEDPTPSPYDDIIPQLDLSSVTESVDRQVIKKPIKKEAVAPPRPVPRTSSSTQKGQKKKKRKSPQKKPVKSFEVAPQQSDPETVEDFDETMEQARDKMIKVLRDHRRVAGRPYDINKMASEELQEEKLSMQRELLKFEARYGRPTTKESKQIMREIYDRYRAVKRMLGANGNKEIDENENTIKQDLNDAFLVTRPFPTESCYESDVTQEGALDTPTSDLLKNLQELKVRRKRLRRILRDFENKRKVENPLLERRVMRSEYEEYRTIKTKVRELEVALAKKGVEIF